MVLSHYDHPCTLAQYFLDKPGTAYFQRLLSFQNIQDIPLEGISQARTGDLVGVG